MSENGHLAGEAELFREKPRRRHKMVDLPVSGHKVRIQSLTERELSLYQAAVLSKRGSIGAYNHSRLVDANRRLIVLCLVDQAGNRILNDSHIAKLADWDAADTSSLYNDCAEHAGIDKGDIEELVKNSEKITVDGGPSDSPSE